MESENRAGDGIEEMGDEHITSVTLIHAKELQGDFLPSLGEGFLKTLYEGMLESEQGIGFVYLIDGIVVGFVLAAKDTKKLFRNTLQRKGFELATKTLRAVILRPLIIPRIVQTILYPKEEKTAAELLVIAVDDAHKHRRIGSELVAAVNFAFAQEGISEYTVLVYKNNDKANRFYQATGFSFDHASRLYGQECNIYKYLPKERNG